MLCTMRAGYDRGTREGNGMVLKRQAYKLPRQRLSTLRQTVTRNARWPDSLVTPGLLPSMASYLRVC